MDQAALELYCVIPPQTGAAFILKSNQLLKIQTPQKQQVSDLFCFSLTDPQEKLSTGRTLDYNDSIYVNKGQNLYSNRSSIMFSIIDDSCGVHDLLMTPCSLKMFQLVAGDQNYHPSCHENLSKNLQHYGISPDHIDSTFNIFMNVKVNPEGRVTIEVPKAKAGDFIILKAEMDLIVGLTACSHEETNAGLCKEIHYRIF